MLPFLTIFTLALTVVNSLTIPKDNHVELGLAKRETAPLKLDFEVVRKNGTEASLLLWARMAKRAKRSVPVGITDNNDVSYLINVFLGSNLQEITVQLDTGSSDLWVFSSDASTSQGGTYDSLSSSDYQDTGESFSILYLDNTGSQGEYVTDDFSFLTSPLISNFQFALVTSSTIDLGILGVANKNQEVSESAGEGAYNNLPWALAAAGVTPKASYSLYLGSEEGKTGSIIFGGIDEDKYTGTLEKFSISGSLYLGVNLDSVSVNGVAYSIDASAVLDSGTTLSLLSQEFLSAVDKVIPPTSIDTSGQFPIRYVSCSQPTDKYFTFDFGLVSIKTSYYDAIVRSEDSNGDSYCILGYTYLSGYYILGDTFLRSAYVYYDLTDLSISLAQASYSTSSNIVSA